MHLSGESPTLTNKDRRSARLTRRHLPLIISAWGEIQQVLTTQLKLGLTIKQMLKYYLVKHLLNYIYESINCHYRHFSSDRRSHSSGDSGSFAAWRAARQAPCGTLRNVFTCHLATLASLIRSGISHPAPPWTTADLPTQSSIPQASIGLGEPVRTVLDGKAGCFRGVSGGTTMSQEMELETFYPQSLA
jgi:hypothetical protein